MPPTEPGTEDKAALDSTAMSPSPAGVPAGFAAGDVLAARFRITRLLGRGGMGEVYEAHDLLLGERVAVKSIRPRGERDVSGEQRFRREIQLARRVTHANVCRIFEAGIDGGVAFLAMELIEGETLAQLLERRGKLPTAEALPLVQQVVAGLGAAHAAGIVHRDLKSQNILLAKGRAVITDFGVARAVGEGLGSVAEVMTAPAAIVGTPAYMSPEQVEGGEVTPASDIYSLGIVIYELVTGRRPFRADTPLATAALRLSHPPPAPAVDPVWDAVILRCLARQPAARFASAVDVARALTARRRRPRWPVLAVLVAAAALGWLLVRPRAPTPVPDGAKIHQARATEAAARGDQRRARDELVAAVALAPDDPYLHRALAATWRSLGADTERQQEAVKAYELAAAARLPTDELQLFELDYRRATLDRAGALAVARRLFDAHPDQVKLALELVDITAEEGHDDRALALIKELRQRPPPVGTSPALDMKILDLLEASPEEREVAYARLHARAAGPDGEPLRGPLLRFDGERALDRADLAAAEAKDAELLAYTAGQGNFFGHSAALFPLAATRALAGDLRGALVVALHAHVVTLWLDSQIGLANSYLALGELLRSADELEVANRFLLESLSMFRRACLHHCEVYAHAALAEVALADRRLEMAAESIRAALAAGAQHEHPPVETYCHALLGEVLLAQGDLIGARREEELAASGSRGTGSHLDYPRRDHHLLVQARIAAAGGDAVAAEKMAEAALRRYRSLHLYERELAARLFLGELLFARDREAGGKALAALENEAESRGWRYYARLAREAART